jgi:hypothetical protein
MLAMLYGSFMSEHFKKETIASTWEQELYGVAIFRPFTQNNKQVLYIPDPATERGNPRCRPTCYICNMLDLSETVEKEKHCSQYDNYDHTYIQEVYHEWTVAAGLATLMTRPPPMFCQQ